MSIKKSVLRFAVIFLVLGGQAFSQAGGNSSTTDARRVESILSQMNLEEKIDLLGVVDDFGPRSVLHMCWGVLRNPLVLGGLGALGVSFFALLSLLSIASVSFAVPATAASYLLETLLAKHVLKEDVRWRRWAAATLVAFGVALLQY